jgi:hypothetical protein
MTTSCCLCQMASVDVLRMSFASCHVEGIALAHAHCCHKLRTPGGGAFLPLTLNRTLDGDSVDAVIIA